MIGLCVYLWVFMAPITTLVARSQDSLLSVSVRRSLVVVSTVLDLRAEKSRVLKHVKPLPCREASRKSRAHSWDRAQAIDALAHGLTNWAIRAPNVIWVVFGLNNPQSLVVLLLKLVSPWQVMSGGEICFVESVLLFFRRTLHHLRA